MNQQDRDRITRDDWLRGVGVAAWSIVGIFVVIAVVAWAVYQVRIIWAPLILAVLLVYLVKPFIDFLERYRVPRVAGGCLVYLVFGGVLVLIGILIVPIISRQTVELVDHVPKVIDSTFNVVADLAASLNLPVELEGVDSISDELVGWFSDPSNREVILEGLSRAGELARGLLEGVVVVLLAPVLAFYIIVDAHNVRRAAERLIPATDRAEVIHLARQVGKALGGFVRGQLVVAAIVGVLSSTVLWILDLPFWLIVGLLAGLLNIVPFIGPWVGGALGVATALIVGDPIRAIWVVIAFLIIQQFDNHLVSPMVLRVAVHLSPVTIILALLAGGSIGGLLGVLIAVPTTAVFKIIIGHLWRTRVLGESWEQAASAVVVEYEVEPLRERFRRGGAETSKASGEDEAGPAAAGSDPADPDRTGSGANASFTDT